MIGSNKSISTSIDLPYWNSISSIPVKLVRFVGSTNIDIDENVGKYRPIRSQKASIISVEFNETEMS